ncbi:MAG TPA: NfeD family protein [Candidatus Acidoferrales bacterium]|jgi:membrane protein implicated in regulation of membrane protease activity|nr:NfeD family protein [Candidatus Acidoferrales bacterium]
MTWANFYLFCFLIGFSLSLLSFLAGAVHLHVPARLHLHFPAQALHGKAISGLRGGARAGNAHPGGDISWFNASTILAFLAWFGGTGYILAKNSHIVAALSLLIASGVGLAGGWIVFGFMARIVKLSDARMLDWDYRIEGAVGTLSSSIRENGVGEITFERNGAIASASARSEDGKPLPKGAEVVISRFEDGIAFVQRWEEFTR